MRLRKKSLLLSVTVFVLMGSESVFADSEVEALRKQVGKQQQLIEQMQKALSELNQEQQETKSKLEKVESSNKGSEVDEKLVSQVVEAFDKEPGSKFLVSGYSSAGFVDRQDDSSTFEASLNPGLHFRLFEDLHVNSELEITLEDDNGTEVELEFVQADYFAHNNLILSAGKMLTPFNAFSERLHPQWINKLPSLPPIYGAHGGGGVSPGIIPVLSDTGVQARGGVELGESSMVNYAFYVVNGPEAEAEHSEEEETADEHGDELEVEGEHSEEAEVADEHSEDDVMLARADGDEHSDLVELEFGENFKDNNNNKALGGRIGFIPFTGAEVGWSGMGGKYSSDDDFFLWGADAEIRFRGLELRGEYVNLSVDRAGRSGQYQDGFYSQAAYRLGRNELESTLPASLRKLEFVVRFGTAETVEGDVDQTTFGLTYWLAESAPLKFAYELNDGRGDLGDNRFLSQLAVGF